MQQVVLSEKQPSDPQRRTEIRLLNMHLRTSAASAEVTLLHSGLLVYLSQ